MQASGSVHSTIEAKKPWRRPAFEFHATGMEVTAYSARD
ncbi:pyrroloquinoline quinone precursor peptide PqqA [Nocardia sp. NPDC051321]